MPLVAKNASQQLIDIVGALGGRWHGRTAMRRCPAHADTTPSLALRRRDRGILVTYFAGCDRRDVLRELADIPLRRHYDYVDQLHSGTGNIERLWDAALPIPGTLAERYLTLRRLMPVPDDLRFHPRCPYRPRPSTLFLPALLAAVREGVRLTAIQRIFLDPHTGRYRMKLMLGTLAQGARQGNGAGQGALALAEGFETARAFTMLTDIPCWASMGAKRLDLIRLPSASTASSLLFDNDAEGWRGAQKGRGRLCPVWALDRAHAAQR